MALKNRFLIGILILISTISFYYFKFDILFLCIITLFIFYELYNLNEKNKYLFFIFFSIFLIFYFLNIYYNYIVLEILIIIIAPLIIFNFFSYIHKAKIFSVIILLSIFILSFLLFENREVLFFSIFVAFFNDSLAYIFGSTLKGPLIMPKISPKKTWSGTLISFLLTSFLIFSFDYNILFSLIASSSLFFGDIYFSLIKRKLKIKDFSNLFGSHGGFLDRYDSILFLIIIMGFKSLNYV